MVQEKWRFPNGLRKPNNKNAKYVSKEISQAIRRIGIQSKVFSKKNSLPKFQKIGL